jgi:hypothetical protein
MNFLPCTPRWIQLSATVLNCGLPWVVAASCHGAVDAPLPMRRVAVAGEPAPGSTLHFDILRPPAVDGGGNALAFGSVSGAPDARGIWVERGQGQLSKVAVTGDVMPVAQSQYDFGPGFDGSDPLIATTGDVAFMSAFLDGAGVGGIGAGTWLASTSDQLKLLATSASVPGVEAPSIPTRWWITGVSDEGSVSIWAPRTGVYSANSAGVARVVARTTLPAPGFTGVYTDIAAPTINSLGKLSWTGWAQGPPRDLRAIWKETAPGAGVLVARESELAPGLSNAPFFSFYSHQIDNHGRVAFVATTLTPSQVNTGIWAERVGSGLQPLVLEGDLATGVGEDVRFAGLDGPVLNVAFGPEGDVAFRAAIEGPGLDESNDSGIWLAQRNSEVRLIAREGQPAPGVESGVTFRQLNTQSQLLVNGQGQVAFFAFLQGPGIDGGNDRGIWAESKDGELKLIARTGIAMQDNLQTSFIFRGLDLGPAGFGANGHVAFLAHPPNGIGSGIFVSDVVAVPEPTVSALLVATTIVAGARRRWR